MSNADDIIFAATLTPYRSLGRRGLLIFMAAIGALWLLAGLFFWSLGAWPVVGFGGVDILAIWLAFWLNHLAARAYEEIEVSRTALVVRKVTSRGKVQELRFNPLWVALEVARDDLTGVTRIAIRSREARVPVGTFLNPDDRKSFARAFGAALAEARR